MQSSHVRTIPVPAGGAGATPTAAAFAAKVPIRVSVRNVGGAVLVFGYSSSDVVGEGGPTSSVYRLPLGASEIFVLAPKQTLYAVGVGAGGVVSVSVSEAIPVVAV